jgi:DNA-binding FadR family transcriptional regulator
MKAPVGDPPRPRRSARAGAVPLKRGFELICDEIRALVANGALRVGDKLPPERELAMRLGVGRNVVREALRSLEIAGLVAPRKGRSGGSFIQASDSRFFTRALGDMTHRGAISLNDLAEARRLIMVDAIGLACERANEDDFAALKDNIDLTERHTLARDFDRRREVATDFYRLIAIASKNQMLVVTVDAMVSTLWQFLRPSSDSPLPTLVESRRRFLRYFRARNVTLATREMTIYLAGLHQHMLAVEAERRLAQGLSTSGRLPVAA